MEAAEQSLREALGVIGGRPLVISQSPISAVNAVGISADNHWLVNSSMDGTARLWDLRTTNDPAASPVVLRVQDSKVNVVAISSNNHWLVTASWDPEPRLWDLSAKDPGASPVVAAI